MRELGLSGSVGAQHNGAAGGVSDRNQFSPANRRDNELRAGLNGGATDGCVGNSANADQRAVTDLVAGFADGGQSVRSGHCDLRRHDPARNQRLKHRRDLRSLLRANDSDDARVGEHRKYF